MPPDDNTLELPMPGEGESEMATVVDDAVQVAGITGLAAEAAACSARRLARADQLQGDSDRMWGIFMTTPNVLTGVGYRTLQQSGGYPSDSGTGTSAPPK